MKPRPPYLVPITLLTAIYLTLELSFNGRVLDVAGGLATDDQVSSIEHFGRVLSGVALALALWGGYVFPRGCREKWTKEVWATVLAWSALLPVVVVFFGERALIDYLAASSSKEERQHATLLVTIRHSVELGIADITGIGLDSQTMQSPEGKSLLALLPFLADSTAGLEKKARAGIRVLAEREAKKNVGTPEDYFNKIYRPSATAVVDTYNRYLDADTQYQTAITQQDLVAVCDKAWHDYDARLAEKGYRADHILPFFLRPRVRSDLQQRGVPVPANWITTDRQTFYRVLTEKTVNTANEMYEKGVTQNIGAVPHGLRNFPEFVRLPDIQGKWRGALHAGESVTLRPEMTFPEVSRLLYKPLIDDFVGGYEDSLLNNVDDFGEGRRFEQRGIDAVRALLVPPFALTFSLAGALLHIFKVLRYLMCLVHYRPLVNTLIAGCSVILAALSVFAFKNSITTSKTYEYFWDQTAHSRDVSMANLVTWIIQMQPYAYPVNEAVRMHVLGGFDFGYQPGDAS